MDPFNFIEMLFLLLIGAACTAVALAFVVVSSGMSLIMLVPAFIGFYAGWAIWTLEP